ncbi:MAG: hypothetical protein J5825_08880 [Lachnospiraceae bacterium]|nr:hypothetical protein [Lachnospiraceae bacterium]
MHEVKDIGEITEREELLALLDEAWHAAEKVAKKKNKIALIGADIRDAEADLCALEAEREDYAKQIKTRSSFSRIFLFFVIGLAVGLGIIFAVIELLSPFYGAILVVLLLVVLLDLISDTAWKIIIGVLVGLTILCVVIPTIVALVLGFLWDRKRVREFMGKVADVEDSVTSIHYRIDEYHKNIETIEQEIQTVENENLVVIHTIPREYFNHRVISFLRDALRDGRASTFAEAVRLYEREMLSFEEM